jgi:hypothetical protein
MSTRRFDCHKPQVHPVLRNRPGDLYSLWQQLLQVVVTNATILVTLLLQALVLQLLLLLPVALSCTSNAAVLLALHGHY